MVSKALRAEFARGDGRVKRKEDERRKKISPSETLFVVNFHEETTKREDLEMLFSPYGELIRIDMKRNYAFVQFRTVDQAQAAKDATNGGKLDQSEITVEFVARRMGEGGGGGGYRGDRRRDDFRGPRRYDDRGPRRYDDRGDYRGGGRSGYGGRDRDYRRRSRSRSRSPPGYRYERRRSRSRSDDRGRRDYRRSRSPDSYRGRGTDSYRGYRSEK
jgi:arginine/serine-rich splicing factor 4/5/6